MRLLLLLWWRLRADGESDGAHLVRCGCDLVRRPNRRRRSEIGGAVKNTIGRHGWRWHGRVVGRHHVVDRRVDQVLTQTPVPGMRPFRRQLIQERIVLERRRRAGIRLDRLGRRHHRHHLIGRRVRRRRRQHRVRKRGARGRIHRDRFRRLNVGALIGRALWTGDELFPLLVLLLLI